MQTLFFQLGLSVNGSQDPRKLGRKTQFCLQNNLSASYIHAATLLQRNAESKYLSNYYGATLAISGVLGDYNIYKTVTYKILLRKDAKQILNMG